MRFTFLITINNIQKEFSIIANSSKIAEEAIPKQIKNTYKTDNFIIKLIKLEILGE